MARVTVEDCLKIVDSRFLLVHIAVGRVLQIRAGAPSFVKAPKNKEVVVALREIASGKVTAENLKQLDDTRSLASPQPVETVDSTTIEVREAFDDATRVDVVQEFKDLEHFLTDEEQDSE